MRKFIGVLPAIAAIGVAGGVTSVFVNNFVYPARGFDSVFLAMTTVAAATAGVCVIPFFGKAGKAGWGWAALGAVLATLGASTALGLLLNAAYFVAAPMSVVMSLILQPLGAISWLATMSVAHISTGHWRRNQKQTIS